MSSDPEAGRKLRNLIDRLAFDYAESSLGKSAAVIEAFVTDETTAEIVQDVVGDAIFRFLLASAKKIRSESADATFDASLDKFILRKTRLTGELAKRLRQTLKQAVLASEQERPKTERRDRLREKQRNKNCYLCSHSIDEEPILDHVWPRSAGGGTGKSNLRIAHPFCEAVKGDFAVGGDAPVGRFAFNVLPRTLSNTQVSWWPLTVSDDKEFRSLVDDIRGSQLKVAILGRQEFQCQSCNTAFSDSTSCTIVRRNEDEPWWFANVIAICDDCAGEYQ